MIELSVNGNYDKVKKWLKNHEQHDYTAILEKYGQLGVERLAEATPKDTGNTAASWTYKISKGDDGYSLTWNNSSSNQGIPIVILIQYGHGTRNGGYVPPRDFINPEIKKVADELTREIEKEVRSAGDN